MSYGRGRSVERGGGVGLNRGVGLGLGVAVEDGVAVTVRVGLTVGTDVGCYSIVPQNADRTKDGGRTPCPGQHPLATDKNACAPNLQRP